MWIHFTSKGKDSTLPQKCKICWLAKPYAFQLPSSGAAQNSQLDQCDGPAVTPFLGVLDFGPVFKLITSQHAVHVQVQQRGIVRVRRCSTRAGKSCAFGTGKRWKKVENGWKKNPHDTSSLTRKINESYAHVPVCAQVILILQTVCVCVCVRGQVTLQVKGSDLSTPSWGRTCCFPLLHHSLLWSCFSTPCTAAVTPLSYLPLSDVWTCIFLFLPLLTSHWPSPSPTLYRIVAASLAPFSFL